MDDFPAHDKGGTHIALFPRMTRPAIRISIEALKAYMPQLDVEGQEIAYDVIRELQHVLSSANADNRRRTQMKVDTE